MITEARCETLIDCQDLLNTTIPRIDFLSGILCDLDSLELGQSALSGLSWILHDIAYDLEQINKTIGNHNK